MKPPKLKDRNPMFPSFSTSAKITLDSDKGRMVQAADDINLGDIIMVEKPHTLFFCPDSEKVSLLIHFPPQTQVQRMSFLSDTHVEKSLFELPQI